MQDQIDAFIEEMRRRVAEEDPSLLPGEFDELLYDVLAESGGHLTKQQLLAIDLSAYNDLVTYPAGVDAPLERRKLLFLQTALDIGVPWPDLVRRTRPYFGQTLNAPFIPVVVPTPVEALTPPPFDMSRQTPERWGEEIDKAYAEYRKGMVHQMRQCVQAHIDNGTLKEFDRPRQNSGIEGLDKTAIAEERTVFLWAVLAFFLEAPASQIAEKFPPSGGWQVDPKATTAQKLKAVAAQKRKRADQIRKRVLPILQELGLPRPARK